MGLKSVVLVLAILSCLAFQAVAIDESPIVEDVRKSFQGESLFNISPRTGMSPGVGTDVRHPPVVAVPTVNVAGSWSLNLRDLGVRVMNLTLAQSGDAIFGQGAVSTGLTMQPVTVAGTAFGDKVNLFVTPSSGQELYRMSMVVSLNLAPASMSGNYLYSAPGIEQPGIVSGKLIGLQPTSFVQPGTFVAGQQASGYKETMPLGPKNEIPY